MTPVDLSSMTQYPEAVSFVHRYGYGDCADLAACLSETYGLTPCLLVGKKTGIPVHAFVLMGSYVLDGLGISTIDQVLERFGEHSEYGIGEAVTLTRENRKDFLSEHAVLPVVSRQIFSDFEDVLPRLGLSKKMLAQEGSRQTRVSIFCSTGSAMSDFACTEPAQLIKYG